MLIEIVALLRGHQLPRIRMLGPSQTLAAILLSSLSSTSMPAIATTQLTNIVRVSDPDWEDLSDWVKAAESDVDPREWIELANRYMPPGVSLHLPKVDLPRFVRPGWRLRLPDSEETAPHARRPHKESHPPASRHPREQHDRETEQPHTDRRPRAGRHRNPAPARPPRAEHPPEDQHRHHVPPHESRTSKPPSDPPEEPVVTATATPSPAPTTAPTCGPVVPTAPLTPTTMPTGPAGGSGPHATPTAYASKRKVVVAFGTGAVVGISFAAAAAFAINRSRLQARRRHPLPTPADPPSPPQPPLVTPIGQLKTAAVNADEDDPYAVPDWEGRFYQSGRWPEPLLSVKVPAISSPSDIDESHVVSSAIPPEAFWEHADPAPASVDEERAHARAPRPMLLPPCGVLLAESGGEELRIDLGEAGGLGLTGAGADDTARGLLVGVLLKNPHLQVQVVTTTPTAQRLLGEDVEDLPGLTVRPTSEAVMAYLETEIAWRLGLLVDHDAPDIVTVRHDQPSQPIPSLILISDAVSASSALRLQAILGLGRTYDICGVVLGAWPSGANVQIAADGLVQAVTGRAPSLVQGARAFRTPQADLPPLLDTIRTMHGHLGNAVPPTAVKATWPAETSTESATTVLYQRLLGPHRIEAAGVEIKKGLRADTRRLLALLAVNPDGLPASSIYDALWPNETIPKSLVQKLYDAANKGRIALRDATQTDEVFILHSGDRYRLDPESSSCDLWEFNRAHAAAHHVGDDTERAALLERAADLYTGELLERFDYEWAVVARETARRHAAEVLTKLARLAADPEVALAWFEKVLLVEPIIEETYCEIMKLQAQLGRPEAVRRTFHRLESAMEALDCEPEEQSYELMRRLILTSVTSQP
jgi:DNA-binding SARP family transcriptional activator